MSIDIPYIIEVHGINVYIVIVSDNSLPVLIIFFSSRRRHTIYLGDWSSDVCSSDLMKIKVNKIDSANAEISATLAQSDIDANIERRSEERRVEKECRSRWSPYH